MNNELIIKCPECNHKFSANDALQNHLKSKEVEVKMAAIKKAVDN